MRRALLAVSFLIALSPAAWSMAGPTSFNFQGKLLDPTTNAPKNGSVSFQFNIYNAASGGTLLWGPESQTLTVTNGVFFAQIGSAVALSTAVFASNAAYLSVCAAPDACPSGEMTPRQQLVAVPYAITAQQLSAAGAVQVIGGVQYSTFTADGSLNLAAGIAATTGTFTATGNTQYSITASSGINVVNGTISAGGGGFEAVGEGIMASTGVFVGTGAGVYSVVTSSGLKVGGGAVVLGNGSSAFEIFIDATCSSGAVSIPKATVTTLVTCSDARITTTTQVFASPTTSVGTNLLCGITSIANGSFTVGCLNPTGANITSTATTWNWHAIVP